MNVWLTGLVRRLLFSRPYLIFLSSTGRFDAERKAVRQALDSDLYDIFNYGDRAPGRRSPERVCREKIAQSDLFVGLLGGDFGSPLPDDPQGRSIVQWEFDCALERAEDDLDLKAYIKRPDTGGFPDARQKAFVDRITDFRQGLWANWFESLDQLGGLLHGHVEGWRREFEAHILPRKPEIIRLAGRVLTGFVLAAALASAGAWALGFYGVLAAKPVFWASLVAAFIIVGCMLLLMQD